VTLSDTESEEGEDCVDVDSDDIVRWEKEEREGLPAYPAAPFHISFISARLCSLSLSLSLSLSPSLRVRYNPSLIGIRDIIDEIESVGFTASGTRDGMGWHRLTQMRERKEERKEEEYCE
jgi:hypothetical protein